MVENPYIGRIVVLLTPVFAGLSGWVSTQAAKYLPGTPALDEAELTAIFVAGALAGVGAVVKWMDNRGKYEERQELLGSTPEAGDFGPMDPQRDR
jgi:NAD(P)H-flavin reductase